MISLKNSKVLMITQKKIEEAERDLVLTGHFMVIQFAFSFAVLRPITPLRRLACNFRFFSNALTAKED